MRDSYNYCAIDEINFSSPCQGDSGSGVVHYMKNAWYIYGLVSQGTLNIFGLCDSTRPTYHTIVPRYLEWIQKAMRYKFNTTRYIVDF